MSDNTQPFKISGPPNDDRVERAKRMENPEDTRHVRALRSSKDFSKILDETPEKEHETEGFQHTVAEGESFAKEAAADGTIAEKAPPPPSLFELSRKKEYGTKTPVKDGQSQELLQAGLSQLVYSHQTQTQESTARLSQKDEGEDSSDSDIVLARHTAESKVTERFARDSGSDTESSFGNKEKFTTRFSTEQGDISSVNPMASGGQPIQVAAALEGQGNVQRANLQELINKLVEQANQMQYEGKTDTTITLKHPPILAGVNLVVTSYDHAKGEFNISFENLTQAAKTMLDLQANQSQLIADLQHKGYTVHILTTTTLTERLVVDSPAESGKKEDSKGQKEKGSRENFA